MVTTVKDKMIGKRMWIVRVGYVLGGSRRKTKRRDQRIARQQITEELHEQPTDLEAIRPDEGLAR